MTDTTRSLIELNRVRNTIQIALDEAKACVGNMPHTPILMNTLERIQEAINPLPSEIQPSEISVEKIRSDKVLMVGNECIILVDDAFNIMKPFLRTTEPVTLPAESERSILEHLYAYVKDKDLDDGKYIERAVYTAMRREREPVSVAQGGKTVNLKERLRTLKYQMDCGIAYVRLDDVISTVDAMLNSTPVIDPPCGLDGCAKCEDRRNGV